MKGVCSEKSHTFAKKCQDVKFSKQMTFTERIKQLRGQYQLPQRQLTATLEMNQAIYCKIERGERKAKREQLFVIAELLKADKDELLSLWLADQVVAVEADKQRIANKVLNIVKQNISKSDK
jgi:transcriptional regulator with XRE-family HTH domain